MFNFSNAGKPNLKFSAGTAPSNTAPFTKPTQGQIGAGGGINPLMLMSMLGGMGDKGGGGQIVNDTAGYSNEQPMVPGGMFQTQKSPYQMAILKALMGPGGGL